LIQCGCHGSFVGNLKLFISDKKVMNHEYELIEVRVDIPSNENIELLVNEVM